MAEGGFFRGGVGVEEAVPRRALIGWLLLVGFRRSVSVKFVQTNRGRVLANCGKLYL